MEIVDVRERRGVKTSLNIKKKKTQPLPMKNTGITEPFYSLKSIEKEVLFA